MWHGKNDTQNHKIIFQKRSKEHQKWLLQRQLASIIPQNSTKTTYVCMKLEIPLTVEGIMLGAKEEFSQGH